MSDTQIITQPGSQQVVSIMTIHAPREVVFKTVPTPFSCLSGQVQRG